MKLFLYIGLASGLFVAACGQSSSVSEVQVQNLEKEVMAVHDEVMPRMTEVVLLAEKADSLVQTDSLTYKPVADALHKADKDMMHWMRSYHLPKETSTQEQLNYLQQQKVLVDSLRVHILDAIQQAQTCIH